MWLYSWLVQYFADLASHSSTLLIGWLHIWNRVYVYRIVWKTTPHFMIFSQIEIFYFHYTLSWKWVHRINLNHDFLFTFWLMNFEYTQYISFKCYIKKLRPFKQLSLVALFLRLFDHSKLYVYPIHKIHFIRVT